MMSIKNQTGSAILTTIFLLAGIVALGFVGIEIMLSGFSSYMTQEASTQAYYTAEAGMERALALHKLHWKPSDSSVTPSSFFHGQGNCSGNYIEFNNDLANSNCTTLQNSAKVTLPTVNGLISFKRAEPTYWVKVDFLKYTPNSFNPSDLVADNSGRVVRLNSRGSYLNASRELQITFCVPVDCAEPISSLENINGVYYDWCGGTCD